MFPMYSWAVMTYLYLTGDKKIEDKQDTSKKNNQDNKETPILPPGGALSTEGNPNVRTTSTYDGVSLTDSVAKDVPIGQGEPCQYPTNGDKGQHATKTTNKKDTKEPQNKNFCGFKKGFLM